MTASPILRFTDAEKKFNKYITPMLAKLGDKPFDDPDWIYEIKWDGYRAVAEVKNKRLYSRNGLSFAEKYPTVFQELQKVKEDVILDGEVVALDENGIPSFQLLQQYEQNYDVPLMYYVFDCLYLKDKSIEQKPLLERKQILESVLPESDVIKYCDHIVGKGKAFFDVAKKKGLEGIIAKRADSKYYEGERTAEWLKIKYVKTEEAIIVGYTKPRGSRKYFGALVLANYKGNKLQYIGHTGTGFNDVTIKDTYEKLQPLTTNESPFDSVVKVNGPVTWVKPELVCNLKYSEITKDGSRRHPVFMGLRIDKKPKEVQEKGDTTETKMRKAVTKKTR